MDTEHAYLLMDTEHCYKITYMGQIKYIIPIQDSDQGSQFWALSGTDWPVGIEYEAWPEIAIIVRLIDSVGESRHLNEMNIETDDNGEEKRPNFLTKLKF